MKATIIRKQTIAEGTLQVKMEPEAELGFMPGQFIFVELNNPPYTDNQGNIRHFSIVNTPDEPGITIATRITESAYKRSLEKMQTGSKVDLGLIGGKFLLPDGRKPVVMIAGGIGITPFISMLRHINSQHLNHKIILIYSNRSRKTTAFFDEIKKISSKNPNIKAIFTMTDDPDWDAENRMINSQFIRDYVKQLDSIFMVVGPPGMVKEVLDELRKAGIKEANLRAEEFTGY